MLHITFASALTLDLLNLDAVDLFINKLLVQNQWYLLAQRSIMMCKQLQATR